MEGDYHKKIWRDAGGDGARGRPGLILGQAYGKKSRKTERLSLIMPNL